mgnify:CR=1 FL=1
MEKLLALAPFGGAFVRRPARCFEKLKDVKVHVIGDTIVDSYTYCSLIGGTAKTPTFSVKYERQTDFSGGAAVVAKHLRQGRRGGGILDGARRRRAEGLCLKGSGS